MKKSIILFTLCLLWFYGITQNSNEVKNRLTGIEDQLEIILTTWKTPGFAVAVIDRDQVIYAKGFGFRDYENKIPANENTLYAIGSCTKSFTASILGMLENENKLKLTESPRKYIPELSFFNSEMNDLITIKDMMSHRTGLPRHDYSWYLFPTFSKDTLIQRIAFQEPFAHVREKWYYNNFMFMAQGVIAEKITGKTWEENVREKIFGPLGMVRSNLSISDLEKSDNIAVGYELKNDSIIKKMNYYHIAGMSPAGSINSSVSEMANWVITWINGGKFNGKQIIPENFVTQAISSQMVIDGGLPDKKFPYLNFSNYGFGWFNSSYKGHFMVEHGGNIDGFSASTCFFPSDSVGVIILTNQNGSAVPTIVRNTIADRILGVELTAWNDSLKAEYDRNLKIQKEAKEKAKSNQQKNTRTSHDLTEYTGKYSNPGYGEFEILIQNDSLFAQFKLLKIWLNHFHYDIFQPFEVKPEGIDTTVSSELRFNFLTNDAGDISALKAKIEPTLEPIEFKRTPKIVEVDMQTMQSYVGEYELAGMIAKVYIKEKNLCLFVPGQPEYQLLPTSNNKFSIKGLDGFKVEFVNGENKAISSILFIQPNGTFEAKKK